MSAHRPWMWALVALALAATPALAQQIGPGPLAAPFALDANPANPTAPASTTATMAGMGGAGGSSSTCGFTPKRSGSVRVVFTGDIQLASGSVTTDGIKLLFAYGTGTAPANGAAATGTTPGNYVILETGGATALSSTGIFPYAVSVVLTGLTVGTQYWCDLRQSQTSANANASLVNVNADVGEF